MEKKTQEIAEAQELQRQIETDESVKKLKQSYKVEMNRLNI